MIDPDEVARSRKVKTEDDADDGSHLFRKDPPVRTSSDSLTRCLVSR